MVDFRAGQRRAGSVWLPNREPAMTDPGCADLTDAEWFMISPLVSKPPAAVVDHDLRLVINGIFFLMRSGSPLRESPPWSTAESYFCRWHADGTWGKIMAIMRKEGGSQVCEEPCG